MVSKNLKVTAVNLVKKVRTKAMSTNSADPTEKVSSTIKMDPGLEVTLKKVSPLMDISNTPMEILTKAIFTNACLMERASGLKKTAFFREIFNTVISSMALLPTQMDPSTRVKWEMVSKSVLTHNLSLTMDRDLLANSAKIEWVMEPSIKVTELTTKAISTLRAKNTVMANILWRVLWSTKVNSRMTSSMVRDISVIWTKMLSMKVISETEKNTEEVSFMKPTEVSMREILSMVKNTVTASTLSTIRNTLDNSKKTTSGVKALSNTVTETCMWVNLSMENVMVRVNLTSRDSTKSFKEILSMIKLKDMPK